MVWKEKTQYERLHAYTSHNKELISTSKKCYCFHCMRKFDSIEVKKYIDNWQTALCPRCGIDVVIPEGIEEVNDSVIDGMNKYRF